MKLSALVMLGFEVNTVIDACPAEGLTFAEVHAAAQTGKLTTALIQRFGELIDLSFLEASELTQMETALTVAAETLDGRERRKTGVENNGLCLVMAIILQAIFNQSKAGAFV